ncbi:MAG: GntR family transcriptional regulator [Actinomycetota bacterium]
MSTSLQGLAASRGFNAIADSLRRALLAGDVTPGEQLSPIGEMARQYGATAITVRRALRALEEEGLVRVEHGVGTFAADWSRQFDTLHLPSFAAEMAARDLRPQTEVRNRLLDARRAEAALALGQPAEAPVHVLTRRRRVGGAPVALQHSYLSAALRGVVEEYAPERSLYEMVREATGRAPLAAEETVRAVLLTDEAARDLEVTAPAVGWVAVRTTSDALGQPLVYDEAFFPSERVEIQVHRHAGVTQLEYRILAGCGGDGVME